jgi:hypothetical protein
MTRLISFIQLIMQEYDSKCLKMYLITLKVFKIFLKNAPITKVNEGESNTPCRSTLEVTYSSVEKLSKALHVLCIHKLISKSGFCARPLGLLLKLSIT